MEQKGNKDVLKNIMWSLVTIVIAVLTITAITSQAKGFSINDAWVMIRHGKKGFMALAMVSVILYIYLEGVAIKYTVCLWWTACKLLLYAQRRSLIFKGYHVSCA